MASSTLCLTINKGPKAGEILTGNPGTVIRIGRVVRGNTVAIKDPGISQKHLTVCFLPEITWWVVTDLGSSNGTYINGCLLPPDEPCSLSDGDLIKIGERTSISVNISAPVDQPPVLPRCERPPRRPNEVKFEDKEWEENVDEPSKNEQKARGRGRKGGRSTRPSRKDEALESELVEPRVTRSLARRGAIRVSVKPNEVKLEDKEWEENVDEPLKNEQKAGGRGRKGGRSTRPSRKDEILESVLVEPRVTKSLAGRGAIRVSVKKMNEEDVMILSNSEFVDAMEKENQSKENNARVEEELVAVDGENNSGVDEVKNNMDATSKENNVRVEKELLDRDGGNNSNVEVVEDNMNSISKENNAGVEEEVLIVEGKNSSRVEQVEDSMNKMTLGEWFDRMEEYLPKSIDKVAEEIIDKLRDKARFFDEYFTQTSNVLVE